MKISSIISGCQAVFNDCLRERTWAQWLCNGNRSIANHMEILKTMCAIAGALNTEQHQVALQQLQESSIWERPLFKDWFTSKWLAEEKVHIAFMSFTRTCCGPVLSPLVFGGEKSN